MGDHDPKRPPPLVEPEVIPLSFITGGAVEVDGELVRVLGWSEFPMAEEISPERRVVVRLAMPLSLALKLHEQFCTQLNLRRREGH
jgi:hypothetical protein